MGGKAKKIKEQAKKKKSKNRCQTITLLSLGVNGPESLYFRRYLMSRRLLTSNYRFLLSAQIILRDFSNNLINESTYFLSIFLFIAYVFKIMLLTFDMRNHEIIREIIHYGLNQLHLVMPVHHLLSLRSCANYSPLGRVLTTHPVVFLAGYVPNSVVRSQMVDFKPTPTDHFVAQERWKPKPVSS